MGGSATALQADLAEIEGLSALIAACADKLGPVTCLINNAACFDWDSIESLDRQSWQAHLQINLRAPVFLTQAFAKQLPDGAGGSVINMIDQKVLRLDPAYFTYTISKSGLWVATQLLAQSLAPRVRVNAIAPGTVLSSQTQDKASFECEVSATLFTRHVGAGYV